MGFKEIIGYLLLGLGVIAAGSAFVVRSPMFIIIEGHLLELWLIVLLAGLIGFSIGAVMIFRSVT
jgi:hypothetical protein